MQQVLTVFYFGAAHHEEKGNLFRVVQTSQFHLFPHPNLRTREPPYYYGWISAEAPAETRLSELAPFISPVLLSQVGSGITAAHTHTR